MLFCSMIFLWVFLPIVMAGYYLILWLPVGGRERKRRASNVFLLIASLIFYAWGGVRYLLVMLFIILTNYLGGFVVQSWDRKPGVKKAALALTISLDLVILSYFKYFNMLVGMLESLVSFFRTGGSIRVALFGMQGTGEFGIARVVLPAGISFFIFQAMSYVVDVYRGKAGLQRSLLDFALYVALFPQLIAGPIVQYGDVEGQLSGRRESLQGFALGQKRFCYGLGKKVLIANTLAEVADAVWATPPEELGAAMAWIGLLAYTFQIYYDFSGYSDMAIGLGRMFGFQFKENFQYPYTALSIRDFWRRWHISLSSWFKEYVYIPLGGSRTSEFCTYRNLLLVFLLTGVWHGANFTFIAWGLFFGGLQVLERLFLGKLLEKNPVKLLNWLYVMLAVMFGWVFFRSDNLFAAGAYLRCLFRFSGYSEFNVLSCLSVKVLAAFLLALFSMGFVQRALGGTYKKVRFWGSVMALELVLELGMLAVSVLLLVSGSYNPFIYFQF